MLEGGIQTDDLITIIGEQTVMLRLREQEKLELQMKLEDALMQRNTLQRTLEIERGGS